jgi:hypothetical protein
VVLAIVPDRVIALERSAVRFISRVEHRHQHSFTVRSLDVAAGSSTDRRS